MYSFPFLIRKHPIYCVVRAIAVTIPRSSRTIRLTRNITLLHPHRLPSNVLNLTSRIYGSSDNFLRYNRTSSCMVSYRCSFGIQDGYRLYLALLRIISFHIGLSDNMGRQHILLYHLSCISPFILFSTLLRSLNPLLTNFFEKFVFSFTNFLDVIQNALYLSNNSFSSFPTI